MAESINVTAVPPQHQAGQPQPNVDPKPVSRSSTVDAQSQPSAAEAARAAEEQTAVSVEELQAAIDQLNEFMRQGQRSLAFSVDNEADEVIVQVRDKETDELVRQIPSSETLDLKRHLQGVIGLLFNDKA